MTRFKGLTVASLTLAAIACQDARISEPPTQEPGSLVVSLQASHDDVGAVLFKLTGVSSDAVTAANPSHQLLLHSPDSASTDVYVAVIGERLIGPLVTFSVQDLRSQAAYAVTLMQVADEQNRLRELGDNYRLTIAQR